MTGHHELFAGSKSSGITQFGNHPEQYQGRVTIPTPDPVPTSYGRAEYEQAVADARAAFEEACAPIVTAFVAWQVAEYNFSVAATAHHDRSPTGWTRGTLLDALLNVARKQELASRQAAGE